MPYNAVQCSAVQLRRRCFSLSEPEAIETVRDLNSREGTKTECDEQRALLLELRCARKEGTTNQPEASMLEC